MIPEKKKQLQTLGALVLLLALAATYTYMSIRKPSTGTTASPAVTKARVAALPNAGNARIRVDLIADNSERHAVGRRNVFQYYVPPPPPPPPPPAPPPPVVVAPPQPRGPVIPAVPPTPPSALSTFKFDGIVIKAKPEKLVASISDGTNRYNVSEGDYIMGRYRVNRVTETNVEIEDLEQNRRQTYTRITTL